MKTRTRKNTGSHPRSPSKRNGRTSAVKKVAEKIGRKAQINDRGVQRIRRKKQRRR